MTKKERAIVDEFVTIINKHKALGSLKLAELFEISFKKNLTISKKRVKYIT